MVSLEKFTRPDFVEGRNTNFSEGVIPGWIPGKITSIDDPKKIGRVKVESPLIEENVNNPNDDDGWVWVGESYTVNSAAGGSHRLLTVGSQVAVMGMLGDPTKLILLACIPNFVEPPSPELDRSLGLHGEQTPGGVFKIQQNNDNSEIHSYPHGVIHHIAGAGDVSTQTRDGAMTALKADGTIISQNKTASGVISPEGTIQWRNAAKGSSVLDKDGNWAIQSQNQSTLKLGSMDALIEGPKGQLAGLVSGVQEKLSGALGKGKSLLSEVQGIVDTFIRDGNLDKFLHELPQSLGKIQDIIEAFPSAIADIAKITSNFSVTELGDSLMNQVDTYLKSGIAEKAPEFRKILEQGISVGDAIAQIKDILPPELASKMDFLEPILTGLSHNPQMQEQFILENLMDGGFASIQNIVGLDLHDTLGEINNTLKGVNSPTWVDTSLITPQMLLDFVEGDDSSILEAINYNFSTETTIPFPEMEVTDWQQEMRLSFSTLTNALPENLQKLLQKQDISQLLQLALTGGNPLQALMGQSALKIAGDVVPDLLGCVGFSENAIAPLQKLIGIAETGNIQDALDIVKDIPGIGSLSGLSSIAEDILPMAVSSIIPGLGGLFGGGKKKANSLINALNGSAKGGTIRVTSDLVEAAASAAFPSAKMVITSTKAALTALGGLSEIYAQGAKASLVSMGGLSEIYAHGAKAGFSSPHGKFGIGGGGGSMITQGLMAMRIIQDVGKSAGMVLHPQSGVSLASFADSDFDHDNAASWGSKTAEITVDEGNVIIRSHLGDRHSIDVTPHGIYVEGYRISQYLNDFELRFNAIELQLAGLISPAL
jgi:hypothetical protein